MGGQVISGFLINATKEIFRLQGYGVFQLLVCNGLSVDEKLNRTQGCKCVGLFTCQTLHLYWHDRADSSACCEASFLLGEY